MVVKRWRLRRHLWRKQENGKKVTKSNRFQPSDFFQCIRVVALNGLFSRQARKCGERLKASHLPPHHPTTYPTSCYHLERGGEKRRRLFHFCDPSYSFEFTVETKSPVMGYSSWRAKCFNCHVGAGTKASLLGRFTMRSSSQIQLKTITFASG